jgi:hypothetical protein
MPPAARYIGSLYESCVDRGLDVAQIRDHLAAQGIRRLASQVVHELDNVYAFHGYSASHSRQQP